MRGSPGIYSAGRRVHARARTHVDRGGRVGRDESGRTLRGVFVIVMPREDIAFHARFKVKPTYGRPTRDESGTLP